MIWLNCTLTKFTVYWTTLKMIWILPWCPKVRLAAKHSHIPMQFANVVQLPYIKKCIDFTKIPMVQQTCFYNDIFFFTEEVTENSTNRNVENNAATLEKIVTVYFVGRYASFLKWRMMEIRRPTFQIGIFFWKNQVGVCF